MDQEIPKAAPSGKDHSKDSKKPSGSKDRTNQTDETFKPATRPVGKKTGWQVARVHLNWRRLVTKIAEITHSREKAIFQQTVKKGLSHKTEWIEIDCDDVPDPANKRNRDRASGSNG